MPGAFHGINLSSNALRAFQRALDTTGHNIANVNTPGYSRQVVGYSQQEPTPFWASNKPFLLGNGVALSTISRVRDMFLGARQLQTTSEQGRLDTLHTSLSQVEAMFQEPGGSGINDALTGFFNAWSNLASNPNEPGNRVAVQVAGQSLANKVRGAYQDLLSLQTQTAAGIGQTMQSIDTLANQINQLNTQIRQQVAEGTTPNDLMDQRDEALRQLSGLVNFQSSQFPDGSITVNVGGFQLVDQFSASQFPRGGYDPVAMTFSDGTNNFPLRGGQLGGQYQGLSAIKDAMSKLDALANNLRTQVNGVHATGTNPLGQTGIQFFGDVVPPAVQTGAIDFDLSAAVKSDPNAIVSSATGLAGDGGIALSLSRLRDASVGSLGNRTFSRFYGDLVGDIGRQTATAQSDLDTQKSISDQISNQIQSISGVSLDDEMANMLRYQRSYQAVARALNVFDQVTEDVINMIR